MNGKMDEKPQPHYQRTATEVLRQLASTEKGLSIAEAEQRLRRNGHNVFHRPEATHPQTILRTDPLVITLLAGAAVTILLKNYTTAFIIVVAAYVHGAATLSLARKHHRFMEHLQRTLTSHPTVLRSGKRVQVDSRELVVGDVLCLEPGELVPADVRIMEARNLIADESDLTGSSELTHKSVSAIQENVSLEQQRNMLYAGSRVVSGEGLGVVVATGKNTLFTERAHATSALALLATPLHHRDSAVKRWFGITLAVLLAAFAAAAIITQMDGHTFWILAVLLAVSLVPMGLTAELLALSQTHAPQTHHRQAAVQHILRSSLGGSTAVALMAIAGLVSTVAFHVPPALVVTQVVVFELLILPLPIAALSWDEQPKPLKHAHINRHTVHELITASAVSAALAVISFVYFFARHHITIDYMNTADNLYAQATTVALATLVTCQWINILFVRGNEHERLATKFLSSNTRLLTAFAGSLVLLFATIYLPFMQKYLGTRSLNLSDWLAIIALGIIYTATRALQRHTRKHTRHAVIDLHRELKLSHSIK